VRRGRHLDAGRVQEGPARRKSIARSETGASGLYFAGLIERLGLADALDPKTSCRRHCRQDCGRGEAEIAVQQISELMQADGIDIVGPLPMNCKELRSFPRRVPRLIRGDRAAAYVSHLAAPEFAAVIRHKGMEPA